MSYSSKRLLSRKTRQKRVRRKVSGTATCPRLAVFRSSQHIYVQAIDDESGHTLASASTVAHKDSLSGYSGNKESAAMIGKKVAESLLEKEIQTVVFDRGGFLYHGRVAALADAARESGLQF